MTETVPENIEKPDNKEHQKGVLAIIFDNAGQPFFLILQNKSDSWNGWEMCKGALLPEESPEEALARIVTEQTNLPRFHVVQKPGTTITLSQNPRPVRYEVYLVSASMNIPVAVKAPYATYLWANHARALEKLTLDQEKKAVEEVIGFVKNHH